MNLPIVIAIDGYSSCGKSTMAKSLAKSLRYSYVDTGAMYRAITLYCLENDILCEGKIDEERLRELISYIHIDFKTREDGTMETFLNGKNVEDKIRSLQVSEFVSKVSAIKFVRKAMVALQQKMGEKKGLVMDGRDIGTVVFPQAELKIFVIADATIRAQRRFEEMQLKGQQGSFDEILKNIQERDLLDETRAESPLRKAGDAFVLDNGKMTIEEQNNWLLERYKETICKR